MRFLIDENVRMDVVSYLKSEGHDVKIVLKSSPDKEIALYAKKDKRILLTHDRHFGNILLYPPQNYSGIIRINIHPPNFDDIIFALNNLCSKLTPEKIEKHLIILEKNRFRIR